MLLVECSVLDKVQVIREGTGANKKLKIKGRFQKCDEQNNNGRVYPRKILEGQVKAIQDKINERSLVGALDHPPNDAIHLSQASHLMTSLKVNKAGDVIGEAEILSTPNGKIVEALLNDGVKIGISSRGLGSVSEGSMGEGIVNEDFKLITFDLVSDPSTKGAFPELSEAMRESNSQKAQSIVSKHKKERVFLTMLESKVQQAFENKNLSKAAAAIKSAPNGIDSWTNPAAREELKKKQAAVIAQNQAARDARAKNGGVKPDGVDEGVVSSTIGKMKSALLGKKWQSNRQKDPKRKSRPSPPKPSKKVGKPRTNNWGEVQNDNHVDSRRRNNWGEVQNDNHASSYSKPSSQKKKNTLGKRGKRDPATGTVSEAKAIVYKRLHQIIREKFK